MPDGLQRIVFKALEKDPAMRYQTAADMRADLRRLLRDSGTIQAPAAQPAKKRSTRTRAATKEGSGRTRRARKPDDSAAARLPAALRRRPMLIGLATATAVVLAAVVFMSRGDDTARGIGASGRPSIAVLSFDVPGATSENAWLARGIPSMLVTGLAQTPGLDVVSNERIDEIVNGLGLSSGGLDGSRVLEVGRQAGAGALVAGSVFPAGSDIRIDMRVQDVATGRVMTAHTVTGSDVFGLVDDLTRRITNDLNVTGAASTRGVAEVTSGNLEAYRLFTEGREAMVNLRRADARRLLEEAVRLDPSFGIAIYYLAINAELIGDHAAAGRYRRDLEPYLDRLPERLRMHNEADEAIRAGAFDKAVESLERLIARYPDEEVAYRRLAGTYGSRDDDRRLDTLQRGVKAVPNVGPLRNTLAYQLMNRGRYPEAIRELEIYARLSPKEPNPYDSLGEAYLVSGQPEKTLESFARALEIDPTFVVSLGGRASADMAMLLGGCAPASRRPIACRTPKAFRVPSACRRCMPSNGGSLGTRFSMRSEPRPSALEPP